MKITIPQHINDQIKFFVARSEVECSGLGKVVITPEGYRVTEVVLLKQENTSSHTEIDAKAVTKAMYELRNSEGGMYFWWHSHVNMPVFWSGTDIATIEEIGQNGLCVAVVYNKKNEKRGAVWIKGHDLAPNLYLDDVTVSIAYSQPSEELKAAWGKEFDEKCSAKVYNFPRDGQGHFLGFDRTGGVPREDTFDIIGFEEKNVSPENQVKLSHLTNNIMYSFSIPDIDRDLESILSIVRQSKGTKHEKKKAYREYKEMAIDQKNYLREREEAYEKGAHHAS